jgi:hypothetical protein
VSYLDSLSTFVFTQKFVGVVMINHDNEFRVDNVGNRELYGKLILGLGFQVVDSFIQ